MWAGGAFTASLKDEFFVRNISAVARCDAMRDILDMVFVEVEDEQ